jgi:hypothetical protein
MFPNPVRWTRRFKFLACLAPLLLLVQAVVAIENKPLPGFDVQALDGSPSNSSDWAMQGKWVVIYLEGQCGPCTHILVRLKKDKYPRLASRAFIIVGGMQPGQVKAMQNGFADLSQATWYADPARNAVRALNLHGAPVTLGVEDKTLRWAISGNPHSKELLPSVLKKWTAQ